MPFYLRTKPRRPLWYPALWAGSFMLVWAVVQRWLSRTPTSPSRLGGVAQAFYVLVLAAFSACVAGGLYWALGTPRLRSSFGLRIGAATAGVALFLTALTLAAGLNAPSGPWSRVLRSEFALSTILLSLVFGWFIARDPLGLTQQTTRVYLTPKDVAALTEAERSRLTLDADTASEGESKSSA